MSNGPIDLAQAGYRLDPDAGVWTPPAGGGFAYTDGDQVERRLLGLVRAAADRGTLSPELSRGITDWPGRYHLSPWRANLLRPLESAFRGRTVLEIGAGCGALSRFMGECGARLVALEGSPRRAAVAAARCADLPDVSVVADTLQRWAGAGCFDVVTLIGVLEYARIHFEAEDGADPVDAMLRRAVELLKPGGILVLAIENQLGLKYFAGYPEDHVSMPMCGIEDLYGPDTVVTFGRAELRERLHRAGLRHQSWLYPFPDYKFPATVLTERAVRDADGVDLAPMLGASVIADPQIPPRATFSLEQVWRPVFRNRLAGDLANSFLVVATPAADLQGLPPPALLAQHFSVGRRPCFAKTLRITAADDGARVESGPLVPGAAGEVAGLRQRFDVGPFVHGQLWHDRFVRLVNHPGWEVNALAAWAQRWLACLAREAGLAGGQPDCERRLDGGLVDAVPRNLLVRGDTWRFIDLEWELEAGVPWGHVLYRGILLSLLAIGSCARPAAGQPDRFEALCIALLRSIGYHLEPRDLARFHEMEQRFQFMVNGVEWIDYAAAARYPIPVRA